MAQGKSGYSDLCKAIGHIVINWSATEQSLDLAVSTVFRLSGGKTLEDELPRSLSRKTKFMRNAFRKLPALSPLAQSGMELMSTIDRCAKQRHEMVHGALACEGADNGSWYFIKLDHGQISIKRDTSQSLWTSFISLEVN